MGSSRGFGSATRYSFALFRLAFAAAPCLPLNLASDRNSPVHSTKGTPSPINGLRHLVGARFQDLFHSPSGVLFTFPSRYWFTIGHWVVFSLGRWSSRIPTEFPVFRRTQDPLRRKGGFDYRALTVSRGPFQAASSTVFLDNSVRSVLQPQDASILVWAASVSLAATREIADCFLFLRVLRCFSSPGLPCRLLCVQRRTLSHYGQQVPPFGYPRIQAYLQLHGAFRRSSRPSSAPSAKASTVRPFQLNLVGGG